MAEPKKCATVKKATTWTVHDSQTEHTPKRKVQPWGRNVARYRSKVKWFIAESALKNHFSAEENFSWARNDYFFQTMGLPPLRNGVYYGIRFSVLFMEWDFILGESFCWKNQPENMLNRILERSIISMISFRKDSSRRLAICLRDPNREIPFSREGKIVFGDRILISPLEKVRNCSIDKAMNRTRK